MSDSFGLKLGIEGEKEFKQALKDINSTFKVLGSELTLVSSQFSKQDKSVEAITARNKVLNKEIEEQQKKIALLGDALENATKSFGESDKRTQNWQIQLNEAKATLRNTGQFAQRVFLIIKLSITTHVSAVLLNQYAVVFLIRLWH